MSIILPEDNSEVLAAISKSVTAVDSKVVCFPIQQVG